MKLKEYIQGTGKGKEAHRIERDALKDPFLYEALEGFDAVSGDHAKRIEELQRLIAEAVRPSRGSWFWWSAAASILLLVSVGGYFLLNDTGKNAESLLSLNVEIETPDFSPKETKQIEQTEQTEQEELLLEKPKVMARVSREEQVQHSAMVESMEIIVQAEHESAPAAARVLADSAGDMLSDKLLVLAFADEEEIGPDSTVTTIRGRITDQHGEPIPGANIMQKSTNIGTVSDINGRFEMKTDNTGDLYVSYIGYETQEIPVAQFSSAMNIALLENQIALEEAVVIAYGTQKKRSITGAVSQTAPKESASNPEPVIGEKAYKQYIENNMVHPTDDRGKKIKGKVKLSFYINAQGRPINIAIEKSLSDAADAEAVRLIEEGPDWTLSNKKADLTVSF